MRGMNEAEAWGLTQEPHLPGLRAIPFWILRDFKHFYTPLILKSQINFYCALQSQLVIDTEGINCSSVVLDPW